MPSQLTRIGCASEAKVHLLWNIRAFHRIGGPLEGKYQVSGRGRSEKLAGGPVFFFLLPCGPRAIGTIAGDEVLYT